MAEEHPDWPDATRSLLRVPELESIERDARGLLSRALNGGRVIGFVGAGTSMAYGRLSWRDLVRIKQGQVLEEAKADKYESESSIQDLRKLLEQQQIKADGTSEPDAFLPAMQLTEQLQDLIDRFERKPEPLFRQDIAKMVGDDNGQLYHILSVGLKDLGGVPSVEDLKKKKLPRVRQAVLIRILCRLVTRKNKERPSICSFVKAVRSLVPPDRPFTRPYHRFVIAILLSLLDVETKKQWLKNEKKKSKYQQSNLRADLIPEERDPLRLMRKLQISRFLTTNYDSEAERLLGEEGLVNLTKGQENDLVHHQRDDPLAPGSRNFVFDKEHTGELFAFAAHTRRREATVVHLHGRAENPESLIVTEGDYQRHYLAAHGNRGLMEDSLRAAFTSSPLLFVGSGVGEDDLVRPLRQFVRDPVMGEGRVAIALVPMWYADQKKEQGTAIRNLQRYGVHTVHYGYVTPAIKKRQTSWIIRRKREVSEDERQSYQASVRRLVARGLVPMFHLVPQFRFAEEAPFIANTSRAKVFQRNRPLVRAGVSIRIRKSLIIDSSSYRIFSRNTGGRKFLAIPTGINAARSWSARSGKGLLVTPAQMVASGRAFLRPFKNGRGFIWCLPLRQVRRATLSPGSEQRWLGLFLEYSRDISRVIEGLAKSPSEQEIGEAKAQLSGLIEKIDNLPGGIDPKTIEGVEVASYPGLAIKDEMQLLKALVYLVEDQYTRLKQDVAFKPAIDLCLNGIQDAITGAFLCARLIRVRQDWSEWRKKWLRVTTPEEPSRAIERWRSDMDAQRKKTGQAKTEGCQSAPRFSTPFRRHHVRLPQATDIGTIQAWFAENPDGNTYEGAEKIKDFKGLSESEKRTLFRQKHKLLRQRFDARAYSPTFLSLHKAMKRASPLLQNLPNGRRNFLLVAHSGVGKGHFTTALAEDEYLKVFLEDLGDPAGEDRMDRWPTAMFNLSFSHEVSSTFDQLAAFLQDCGKVLGGDHFRPISDLAERLKGDRLNRLDALLRGWGDMAKAGHFNGKRAVVVFNRFASLFDPAGYAKNAQTAQLFELLTGEAARDAPIDLVLICGERSIPLKFRHNDESVPGGGQIRFHELREEGLSEGARIRLDRRMTAFPKTDPFSLNFIHLMRPARAILLATSYFPSVAMAIALRESVSEANQRSHRRLIEAFSARSAFDLRMSVREALGSVEGEDKGISARESFPVLLAAAAWRQENGQKWTDLPGHLLELKQDEGKTFQEVFYEKLTKMGFTHPATVLKNSEKIDLKFRALYEACGNRRFAFTLLMACAYQYLLPIAEAPSEDEVDETAMRRAFEKSLEFLEYMRLTLEGLPHARRDDLLLERILDAYRGMHETPNFPLPGGLISVKMGMPLFDLMQAIIWHLSVIGQPVVTDVLLEIPAIEAAARKAASTQVKADAKPDVQACHLRHVLVDALFLLEFRCLIFELHSSHLNPAGRDGKENDGQRRWAVHRLVQRHAFLALRAPYVDYASADQFALTLINSMPNEVPRLTASAYRRLVELVASLSGYPEPETRQSSHSVWLKEPQDDNSVRGRSQLLRAALGVVRSALSIPTLLRLDTREPDSFPLPFSHDSPVQRGVLEEHRLMLRWLLHQADDLSSSIEKLPKEREKFITRPFYAEELVWLHNEIATLAYVQGHMADAVAAYNRADEAARTLLEPLEDSPLRRRISLNRANADIARGRLGQAETTLRRLASADDEHPAIGPIARGILGLVQHLRGRKDEAIKEYRFAAKALGALRRSRASAIVLRHHGDMLRSRKEFAEARLLLDQAYTFAVEGNHEDMRHLTALSLIRLDLIEAETTGSSAAVRQEQHRKLDEADTYGRVMGIAALQCEVAFIRTWLQIRDGDLKTAASVAGGGLALASANDMQIRTTSLLLLLCEIYVKREQYTSAQPLLDAALRLANATEYHSAHQRAAALLARISSVTGKM